MKARLLLTGALLAVCAGALSGCVVYGRPAGYGYVEPEASIMVRPAPYYYDYGPRYYYDRRPYRRW